MASNKWRRQIRHDVRGLHIEMAALKSIRTLLIDNGWTRALVEVGDSSPGTVHFCQFRASLRQYLHTPDHNI